MNLAASASICVAMLIGSAAPAMAERADRQKPINLEADRVSVDDRNKVHTFEGHVSLAQGTLTLRADKIVVSQDKEGFQKGVATGRPAQFRQKREGRAEYLSGEAERIEYDSRTERVQFFVRAIVRSGADEVRGEYIQYDGLAESYLVTGKPEAQPSAAGGTGDRRVRAVIQPRTRDGSAPNPPAGEAAPPSSPQPIPASR